MPSRVTPPDWSSLSLMSDLPISSLGNSVCKDRALSAPTSSGKVRASSANAGIRRRARITAALLIKEIFAGGTRLVTRTVGQKNLQVDCKPQQVPTTKRAMFHFSERRNALADALET